MVIGPTSSTLTNLVFSKKGTRVVEIIPKYKYDYVVNLGGYVDHINKKKTFRAHYLGTKNLFEFFKNKSHKNFTTEILKTIENRIKKRS